MKYKNWNYPYIHGVTSLLKLFHFIVPRSPLSLQQLLEIAAGIKRTGERRMHSVGSSDSILLVLQDT